MTPSNLANLSAEIFAACDRVEEVDIFAEVGNEMQSHDVIDAIWLCIVPSLGRCFQCSTETSMLTGHPVH
jgi:hypothetical protein